MNDMDYFRSKINCAVEQIRARGLRMSNLHGYGVIQGSNGLWKATERKFIWPTAVFLIGRLYVEPYLGGEYIEIRKVLDVPSEYVGWFDSGFTGAIYYDIPSQGGEAYELGRALLKGIAYE